MQRFFTKKNTIITVIAVVVVTAIVYRLVRGTWFGGIMEGAVRARIMGSGGTGQYEATFAGPMERKQVPRGGKGETMTYVSVPLHGGQKGESPAGSGIGPSLVAHAGVSEV